MEKYYRFAGIEIAVDVPEEKMYIRERNLEPFRVERVTDPHRFSFSLVPELDGPEGECIVRNPEREIYRSQDRTVTYVCTAAGGWQNAYLRITHENRVHQVQVRSSVYPDRLGVKAVLNSLEIEQLVTEANGFLLHCSYIDIGGRAVLFTAPSGTGKSTQADLWNIHRGAEIVNGDRAAVRCEADGVYACGIPFSGSSAYSRNREGKLAAVVYLTQAPETEIRRMKGYEAFARIWEGVSVYTWDPQAVRKVSALVERVASSVPVYHLACTPDESAVIALENRIRKDC